MPCEDRNSDPANGLLGDAWFYRGTDHRLAWTGPERTDCTTVKFNLKQVSDGTVFLSGSIST